MKPRAFLPAAWMVLGIGAAAIAQPSNPLAPAPAVVASPWVGSFRGAEFSMLLEGGPEKFTGTITHSGKQYPVSAGVQDGLMKGEFTVAGTSFAFEATLVQGTMVLKTGSAAHTLTKDAPANPLGGNAAPAAEAPAAPEAVKETPSGNRYSHSSGFGFVLPEGWKVRESEEGLVIERPAGEQGPSLVFESAGSGEMKDVDDPRVPALVRKLFAENFPRLKPLGDAESLRTGLGKGLIFRYEGVDAEGKENQARHLHVTIFEGSFYLLTAWGDAPTVNAEADRAKRIFASIAKTPAGGPATPATSPDGLLPPAAGKQRIVHPQGLVVDVPRDWRRVEAGEELILSPSGDLNEGAYFLYVEPVDAAITSASDQRILAYVDGQMQDLADDAKRTAGPTEITGGRMPGVTLSYESPSDPQTRCRWFIAVKDGKAYAIMAMATAARLATDDAALTDAFKSFQIRGRITPSDTAPMRGANADAPAPGGGELVGTWRFTRHASASGGYTGGSSSTSERTIVVNADGTFTDTSQTMASAGGVIVDTGPTVIRGRWRASGGSVMVETDEGRINYRYAIGGGFLELRDEEGGVTVWERVN